MCNIAVLENLINFADLYSCSYVENSHLSKFAKRSVTPFLLCWNEIVNQFLSEEILEVFFFFFRSVEFVKFVSAPLSLFILKI